MTQIQTFTLDCGAILLVEPIASAASVAINWKVPAGSALDPDDSVGESTMLGEMVFRGAGGLDSRELSDAMDRLGLQRSSQVLTDHLQFTGTMLGSRLADGLPLLTSMVLDPALPEDAIDPVRSLCLQSIDGLDDDPQHLAMLRLRENHKAVPLNRHGYGDRAAIESMGIDALRAGHAARFVPGGSIIAIAGAVDPDDVRDQFNTLLDGWTGAAAAPAASTTPARGTHHIEQDSAQVHIGLAWDAVPESDPHAMLERVGIGVLSGGTSARLFTEVRQKRSLCYSVGASFSAGRTQGFVTLYAGTTPERAQETLDVSVEEIHRLRAGAEADEFRRAVIGLKSQLVMQGESTDARASALAWDYYRIGRARSLEEVADAVDAIDLDGLNAYLADRTPGEMTLVTVGPHALAVPDVAATTGAP